jgi:pyridinium-3,5-biscarboxylic acid mononucleotide synthase
MPGFSDLGFSQVDVGRMERRGFPEAVFSEGKSPEDLALIVRLLAERNGVALATRANQMQYERVREFFPDARFESVARCIVVERRPLPKLPGRVAVVSAGTTDRPVLEEARVTLELFGNSVEVIQDVGVAGIHRTLAAKERIDLCSIVIVVAGMEGALPSVIAGMVSKPVIAVPTSVGYGASFGGIAALLGMLNSCAGGVTVVNIDNGFGAAYAASLINREIAHAKAAGS